MYDTFFGFKEKPFKLVPNPAYFFLSKCHEEALAHLNYAISQGDGFVQITGEVGTGKTTLCRAFLESLDKSTKAAYIFNPKLGPKQLLMNINGEFGIHSENESTKGHIDALNSFLMRNKTEGNKVILLVDEAQNLTPHEVKTIISRAGENTKIIFTGDIYQIDTPYLDSQSNGLSYLIDRLQGQSLYAHITLEKGERSELANLANELL